MVYFNISKQSESAVPDPYGTPLGVAVDRNANVYVANNDGSNQANVTMYPARSLLPLELKCNKLTSAQGLVVDNEGDVYVLSSGRRSLNVLYEIPSGPLGPQAEPCAEIRLKTLYAGITGLAIDPATDDLIVMTDPDMCAGGQEGRITIYPKPYESGNAHSIVLGGNCPGSIWLNAASTMIYYGDSYVANPTSFIRQATYPGGKAAGAYRGGNPGLFVTIPNSLPN